MRPLYKGSVNFAKYTIRFRKLHEQSIWTRDLILFQRWSRSRYRRSWVSPESGIGIGKIKQQDEEEESCIRLNHVLSAYTGVSLQKKIQPINRLDLSFTSTYIISLANIHSKILDLFTRVALDSDLAGCPATIFAGYPVKYRICFAWEISKLKIRNICIHVLKFCISVFIKVHIHFFLHSTHHFLHCEKV